MCVRAHTQVCRGHVCQVRRQAWKVSSEERLVRGERRTQSISHHAYPEQPAFHYLVKTQSCRTVVINPEEILRPE